MWRTPWPPPLLLLLFLFSAARNDAQQQRQPVAASANGGGSSTWRHDGDEAAPGGLPARVDGGVAAGPGGGLGSAGGRTVHWVLRSTDLLGSMLFHAEVLNQRVLRHEENAAPCPVTCNGAPQPGRPASGPWSKTMMGSDPEDKAYAIELTHTYGVTKDSGGYHPGTHPALSALAVVVPDPVASSDAAAKLGYPSAPLRLGDAHLVWGPDDYRYVLLPQQRLRGRAPRVHHVAIRVSDLRRSVAFYTSLLGMAELPDERVAAARALAVGAAGLVSGSPTVYSASVMSAVLGYNGTGGGGVGSAAGSQWGQNDQQIPIVLLDDGVAVTHTSWAGRHAIALPDEAIRRVSARLEAQQSARHEARERCGPPVAAAAVAAAAAAAALVLVLVCLAPVSLRTAITRGAHQTHTQNKTACSIDPCDFGGFAFVFLV
jgi:catechol 2,3-dioxygenase-like lactoylglutathione lyase family enzyme